MLVFVLAACGGKGEEESSEKKEGGSATGFEGNLAAAYNSMEDAVAVITIDIESLKEKSDLKSQLEKQMGPNPQIDMALDQIDGLVGKIHIIASVSDLDPEMREQPKGKAIIAAKILDVEKFNGILAMSPLPEGEEKNGFTVVKMDDNAIMAYSGETFLVFADPEGGAEALMEAALSGGNTEMNELLTKSINSAADISIFSDMGNFMGMYSKIIKNMDIPGGNMEDYMDMYKGASTVVEMTFENGKFVTTISNNIAEKASDLNLLGSEGVSKDVLGMVANKPIAFFTANIKWQEMWAMASKFMNPDDLAEANKGLEQIGMSMEQLMELFDGKMAFAYNGMSSPEKPNLGFYVGLTDPKKVEEILPADKVTKDESGIYSADGKVFMYFGDNYGIIHTDKEFLQAVVGGTKGEISIGDQENILSSPINYYCDFNALFGDEAVAAVIKSEAPAMVTEILSNLDKAYGNGGMSQFDYVLETNDKNSNILVQIIGAVQKAMAAGNEFAEYSKADSIEEEF